MYCPCPYHERKESLILYKSNEKNDVKLDVKCTSKTHDKPTLYKCTSCNLIFSEHIKKNFEEEYSKVEDTKYIEQIPFKEKYFKLFLNRIKPFLKKKSNVLEIGSYYGVLGNLIKPYVDNYTGLELSKHAAEYSKKKYSLNVKNDSLYTFLNKNFLFDVIVMSDVVEHLDDPFPEPIPFQHSIKLNKLEFRYNTQTPWVLKGLDLTIPRGSRVGFIGDTGSGKSTLFDIMMGLLQQTKGTMLIDDQPITKKNYRAWQAHIAHVPQVIFLSDASIAENIAFGVPLELIDFDRVHEAAKKAKISQTVESWDKQYSTKVGERGVRLSGGQRQRIGIARALYKQADVIVLDEATSSLDNDTEAAVMESINSIDEGITVLIVAHRLSTLKGCSQIVELSNGVIKRTGTYKEIIG